MIDLNRGLDPRLPSTRLVAESIQLFVRFEMLPDVTT